MNFPDPPSAILRKFFLDKRVASETTGERDFPVFISSEPQTPSECITLYDEDSDSDGRLMEGEFIEHPIISVRVRAEDYEEGWAKLNELEQSLVSTSWKNVLIASRKYRIQALHLQRKQSIGKDADDRSLFTAVLQMTVSLIPQS